MHILGLVVGGAAAYLVVGVGTIEAWVAAAALIVAGARLARRETA
jgi:hypothetical protein